MDTLVFRALAYTDIETLLECFNESFKVYYVPLQLTKEQLVDKIYAEAIDMKLSYGAFDNDKLVAFILHGIDTINNRSVAYNAGTGVLPAYRGKHLSYTLYEYCIAQLKEQGIEKCALDVIDQNIPATKTYERCGLTITRKMISYKGDTVFKKDPSIEIRSTSPDWKMIEELCAWQPAWQYNNNTLKRAWNNYSFIVAGNNAEAYCIANLKNGRIAHFGSKTADRYLSAIFGWLADIQKTLMIIHVDERAADANSFIMSAGLSHFITSYEMEMDL